MRKKELWMFKGAEVLALGKPATIDKMQENNLDGTDYVYYINCIVDGENISGRYHPSDITERDLKPYNMSKKQTAMQIELEWCRSEMKRLQQIPLNPNFKGHIHSINGAIELLLTLCKRLEKSLQAEREQIEKVFDFGKITEQREFPENGNEYYKNTYGNGE